MLTLSMVRNDESGPDARSEQWAPDLLWVTDSAAQGHRTKQPTEPPPASRSDRRRLPPRHRCYPHRDASEGNRLKDQDQQWADMLSQVFRAGIAKGRTVEPSGMTVVRADPITDETIDGTEERIPEGPYGGAALEFASDGNPVADDFLTWLQLERPTEHPPPFDVTAIDDPAVVMKYVSELGDSAEPNAAAANEMRLLLDGRIPGLLVTSRPMLS